GGRYAQVAVITPAADAAAPVPASAQEPAPGALLVSNALPPPSLPASPSASPSARPAAAAAAASASPPRPQDAAPVVRPTPVLVPIQGPLMLEGHYLGDLSGAVDGQGQGEVDAARFLDLIKPLVAPALFEDLRARAGTRERVA